jgi:Integrase core domain.
MSGKLNPEEFKIEAVKQVIDRGHSVSSVATRLEITIRIHEGWLYLAVVVDLFSRKIIGWSMQSRMTKDIVLNALLMAVWQKDRCWFTRTWAVSTQAMSGSRS